jgi:Protein of unknown function (DUF2752)
MEAIMTQASKHWFLYARLAFFILVPMVLLLLPSDYFDQGQALCLSVLLFKQECYACGLTRSVMHLIHFEFTDAWYYNPLGFIVVPGLAWQWITWFLKDWRSLQMIRSTSGTV